AGAAGAAQSREIPPDAGRRNANRERAATRGCLFRDGIRAPARLRGFALGHHDAPSEITDLFAPLVVAPRLDRDNPAVGFAAGLLLLEHGGFGIDRVAVERRHLV